MTKNILITLLALFLVLTWITSWRAHDPVYKATVTLDFGNTLAGTSTDLTATVTGAQVGDAVLIGPPAATLGANGAFVGVVSNTNEVTVRFINPNLLVAINPASASFKIVVIPVR